MRRPRVERLSHPNVLSAFGSSHFMHPCTLGDHHMFTQATLVAAEVLCDVVEDRSETCALPCHCQAPSSSLPTSTVTVNVSNTDCFKSASVVTIYLEFELAEWQGRKIRCSALVNNKYHWSQDEGWGDWWLCGQGGGEPRLTGLRCGVNLQPLRVETWGGLCQDRPDSQSKGMGWERRVKWTSKQGDRRGKKCWYKMDKEMLRERDWFPEPFTPYPTTLCDPPRLGLSIWYLD